MYTEKQLYRSRNALIGGVCAGVADYFSLDPLVARILTVALSLSTAGLFVIAYIALWVILPEAPRSADPVEVAPQSAKSDTYGPIDHESVRSKATDAARAAVATTASPHAASGSFIGSGHVPPEPPPIAAATWRVPSEYATYQPRPVQTKPPQHAQPPASYVSDLSSAQEKKYNSSGVKAALWFGTFLLFFGVAALLGEFIQGVSWWQFWPLIFGITGIVMMVVPAEAGRRVAQFVNGLILFCLSGTLLLMSLDIVNWVTIELMLRHLWPLLVMMLGFFIIGAAVRSAWWTIAAGLCFVTFCVVGLLWLAVPGATNLVVFALPFGREYYLYLGIPWF